MRAEEERVVAECVTESLAGISQGIDRLSSVLVPYGPGAPDPETGLYVNSIVEAFTPISSGLHEIARSIDELTKAFRVHNKITRNKG